MYCPFCNNTVRTRLGYLGKQIMKSQTHHIVPINKGPVAFLGMAVIKSNSRRLGMEVVNKFVLDFLLLPTCEMTPRSGHGINSTHRRAWASQHSHTGHKPAWFTGCYEHSSDLINGALGVKDDCRTLGSSSTELQHRKAATQEKEDGLGAHPTIPQHYIGVGFTDIGTQQIFGWLCRKDLNAGKRHQWSMRDHQI